MASKLKVGIVGGAGYTGGETIRVLLTFVHSRSNAGNPLHEVHPDLLGDTDLTFSDTIVPGADVIFLCLGHGESKKFLQENPLDAKAKVIDLSQDFRLGETSGARSFVYGLPELNKSAIQKADNIANPGCFATAIQVGLLPLAKAGLLKEVYATGITGSTGAGQKLQDTTHFTWRANNISAYKTLTHQHLGEMNRTLKALQPKLDSALNFVPWRGDFTRGIFVSSIISSEKSLDELNKLSQDFYKGHAFTVVTSSMINLKQVVNNNKCLVFLEKEGNKLVVHSALDNLLKGAS